MSTIDTETSFSRQDLKLLYEVSTSIHAIKDFDEMLRVVLHKIKEVFQIDGASLALHEPDQKMFYFIKTVEMQRDGGQKDIEKMHFPDHLGVAGWVLQNNQSVLISDASKDKRIYKEFSLDKELPTRSMICVPLRTPTAITGVLYAINKLEGSFSAKDSRLMEIMSVTLAMAIENAKNYGVLKQYANSLEEKNRRLMSEVQQRFKVHGLIASSSSMRQLFSLMEKVIDVTTTIMIQGETGTGKELIAKVIHYNGPLKDKPFVAENCGALSENLLESELFGHVKGAFTGAISDKKGLFEMADGGTVLLDEIGETPPSMQVKLLRVLQDGQFRPVGASYCINVNVRIIASTNRNLEDEMAKGNFREDLYYRVNVFPLTIPPLRERKEDIPILAAHFLKEFAQKFNRTSPRLTSSALELLSSYDWPGNVRELQNEMERALTLAGSDIEISEKYLSSKIFDPMDNTGPVLDRSGTLQEVTERIEIQMVREALETAGGNRSHASNLLGITRQGLLNKIKRYDIEK
ncbi:Response regulator of zinc sigma-54-dependent two-component system [Olavius sp. associated proteobacterium Delta 1]|nr:Response regulator of zinc sigma-54-dependent two-component system [Olavius sp. associated proteobacterium Delta 1]